jgi:hypothetical protein
VQTSQDAVCLATPAKEQNFFLIGLNLVIAKSETSQKIPLLL